MKFSLSAPVTNVSRATRAQVPSLSLPFEVLISSWHPLEDFDDLGPFDDRGGIVGDPLDFELTMSETELLPLGPLEPFEVTRGSLSHSVSSGFPFEVVEKTLATSSSGERTRSGSFMGRMRDCRTRLALR